MENKDLKIVVSGDICVNSLLWKTPPLSNKDLSWQHFPRVHNRLVTGEALLLAKLVALSTGASTLSPKIHDTNIYTEKEVLLSSVELDQFSATAKKTKHKVYRIKDFLGFTGPTPPGIFPKFTQSKTTTKMLI